MATAAAAAAANKLISVDYEVFGKVQGIILIIIVDLCCSFT